MEKDFTHFNKDGRALMVDVGEKKETRRTAVAGGSVLLNRDTFELVKTGGIKKGDVLTVAQTAGIMGAKRTSELIPMCHIVSMNGIDLHMSLCEEKLSVDIEASVCCYGKTGVEMEALTAVSVAALTVYDMCKAVQKDIVITDIRLIEKRGGSHGDFFRKEDAAPSIDRWLEEARAGRDFTKSGMYLAHTGIVRETQRAEAREGKAGRKVAGMELTCDRKKAEEVRKRALSMDGIHYARLWVNEGTISSGDTIMKVLIGGDIRENTINCLTYVVMTLKTECIKEKEICSESGL